MKDVIIKPDAPNTLLLDKHADYIAAYGSKKDDYVSKNNLKLVSTMDTFAHFYFFKLLLLPVGEPECHSIQCHVKFLSCSVWLGKVLILNTGNTPLAKARPLPIQHLMCCNPVSVNFRASSAQWAPLKTGPALLFIQGLLVFVQEYTLSEYLRMSGIYWGLTVMDLMGQLPRMNRQEIVDFIKSCQHECGGISASIGHDPHLLYTLSAVQVSPRNNRRETVFILML